MLGLIATYTHTPSCRNWTRIGTKLDSAILAVAQPNGPKPQLVTQTRWEDRRLPGECLESFLGVPMTNEARTAAQSPGNTAFFRSQFHRRRGKRLSHGNWQDFKGFWGRPVKIKDPHRFTFGENQ